MCIYIMYKTHIAYIIANGVQTDKKKTVWSLKQKRAKDFGGWKVNCASKTYKMFYGEGKERGRKKELGRNLQQPLVDSVQTFHPDET